MIQIKSLANISFNELYECFSTAFAEYEVQLTDKQLYCMLKRRGYKAELSFGAFDKNRLVSFTCNGIGLYNGKHTAYDTGTGTLKEYRGKGIAGKVFKFSLPYLRDAGINQYLLEVLKHNESAIAVYKKLGFVVNRDFSFFIALKHEVQSKLNLVSNNLLIKSSKLNEVNSISSWFDFYPSWQNSVESIARQPDSFVIKSALYNNETVGCCIVEPVSGDITQIAVNPDFRRQGIATALCSKVIELISSDSIKLINTDNQFPGINAWANSVGLVKRGEQFEMILKL